MPTRTVAQRLDWIDPAALFLGGPAQEEHAFWLDAGPDATAGWSWLGVGEPAASLPGDLTLGGATADIMLGGATGGGERPALPGPFPGGWVGWTGYDAAARRAGAPGDEDEAAPGELALRVRRFVAFDHAAGEAWLIAPEGDDAASVEVSRWRERANDTEMATEVAVRAPSAIASARHDPEGYAALIAACRAAIRRGDAYQLCLTTRFSVVSSGAAASDPAASGPAAPNAAAPGAWIDPVATYLRLRASQSAHHGGYLRSGAYALLSASPEQFLRVDGGVVRTRPIKGTRPRGATGDADAALARALAESPKERAENVMIVDLMRNDLQQVCLPGSVAAERLLEVESYPSVHQLVSTVAGRLRPGATLGGLLDAAFPAGSMTGAPKLSAMTILHDLERAPRGVFAGCFGWVGSNGALDLAMTIRSIVVYPGGAYVGAGGGITWLSDADAEVAEVAVKAAAPLAALGAMLPASWRAAAASWTGAE